VYVLISRPIEGWIGVGMIIVGALIYFLSADKAQDSGR